MPFFSYAPNRRITIYSKAVILLKFRVPVKIFDKGINEMQKVKIVKNVLGRRIEPYGFTYDGYCGSMWNLKRVADNDVEQFVVVYKPANDKSLRLELCTSVQIGHIYINSITDDPKYSQQFISYTDDNDFANILELFGDFVIEYGLAKLDEISTPPFLFEPDEQMYAELLKNNIELANSFVIKHDIDCNTTLEDSFDIIESIITRQEDGKRFDDVEKLVLLEITAFFSNKMISAYSGNWEWDNDNNKCSVNYLKGKRQQWDFLVWFIYAWEKSEFDSIKASYKFLRDVW